MIEFAMANDATASGEGRQDAFEAIAVENQESPGAFGDSVDIDPISDTTLVPAGLDQMLDNDAAFSGMAGADTVYNSVLRINNTDGSKTVLSTSARSGWADGEWKEPTDDYASVTFDSQGRFQESQINYSTPRSQEIRLPDGSIREIDGVSAMTGFRTDGGGYTSLIKGTKGAVQVTYSADGKTQSVKEIGLRQYEEALTRAGMTDEIDAKTMSKLRPHTFKFSEPDQEGSGGELQLDDSIYRGLMDKVNGFFWS